MKTSLINAAWITNDGEQVPHFTTVYNGVSFVETCGQSVNLPSNPAPNICVFHVVCDDATALLIEADTINYDVLTDDGAFITIASGENAADLIRGWLGDENLSVIHYIEPEV